jgi:hypothetical protein
MSTKFLQVKMVSTNSIVPKNAKKSEIKTDSLGRACDIETKTYIRTASRLLESDKLSVPLRDIYAVHIIIKSTSKPKVVVNHVHSITVARATALMAISLPNDRLSADPLNIQNHKPISLTSNESLP